MTRTFLHQSAAQGRWLEFSLLEQLANIGSEVGRTRQWQGKDEEKFQRAGERSLELFDLTLEDPRWKGGRLREIARARELFCDALSGGKAYATSLEDLEKYFDQFAFAARNTQ